MHKPALQCHGHINILHNRVFEKYMVSITKPHQEECAKQLMPTESARPAAYAKDFGDAYFFLRAASNSNNESSALLLSNRRAVQARLLSVARQLGLKTRRVNTKPSCITSLLASGCIESHACPYCTGTIKGSLPR